MPSLLQHSQSSFEVVLFDGDSPDGRGHCRLFFLDLLYCTFGVLEVLVQCVQLGIGLTDCAQHCCVLLVSLCSAVGNERSKVGKLIV